MIGTSPACDTRFGSSNRADVFSGLCDNRVARAVARDLLQLFGLRPRSELRELAERFGVLP
jgi:hypothetical protein